MEGVEHRLADSVGGGTYRRAAPMVVGGDQAPTAGGSSNDAHQTIMAAAPSPRHRPTPVPASGTRFRVVQAPKTIICVDCGGTCHLLAHPETEFQSGDPVAYRCADCMDRWDLVMPDEEDGRGDELVSI